MNHTLHLENFQDGSIADRLIDLATEAQVDLFVMGTHPDHSAWARRWSVTHEVLGVAPMSVVCVPGTNAPAAREEKDRTRPRPSIDRGTQVRR